MGNVLLKTFLMIFLAEMGDKSQFLMVAMSAEYRKRSIVAGVALAICVLNLLAITVGTLIGDLLPSAFISLVAGAAFLFFAYSGIRKGGTEETDFRRSKQAVPAIFGTYFLAELGDKTQLTALTLAAGQGGFSFSAALSVFLGASLALFLADMLGFFIGCALGKHLPERLFGGISFLIFTACGAVRLLDGIQGYAAHLPNGTWISVGITVAVLTVFAVLCIRAHRKSGIGGKHEHDTGTEQPVSVQ